MNMASIKHHPPVLLPSSTDRIVIAAQFPNITPELLFDHFVRPSLVKCWWAPSADIHARQGGLFHYIWPDLGLHLRGQYTFVERGNKLSFTWKWDHEQRVPRSVMITFEPCADGAMLTIQHLPYTAWEQQERRLHGEAWLYYLTRLQEFTQRSAASAAS
jgi:uncharacterized protein YndB with AHSA1/START domain